MAIDPRININENQVIFRRDGGHKHDGLTSSLIDYTRYSVFDFLPYPIAPPGSPRRRFQDANEISFKSFIVSAIEERVLNPQGIRVQANAITAREIVAGTISANELSSNVVLVNNIIRSGTFNGTFHANGVINDSGTAGWAISHSGSSVFSNSIIRGTVTSGDLTATGGTIAGWAINDSGFTKVSGPNTTRVFHNNTSQADFSARFLAEVAEPTYTSRTSLHSLFVEAFSFSNNVTQFSLLRPSGVAISRYEGETLTHEGSLGAYGLTTASVITPNNGGLDLLTGRIASSQLVAENAIAKVGFFGADGIGNLGVVFAFGLSILAGSSSTRDVKRNIEESTPDEVENLLMNLRPVKFQYKYKPEADSLTRRMSDEKIVYGFIAEEVAEVYRPLALFMPKSEDWWNREDVTYETMVEDFKPSDWDQRAVTSLLVKGYQQVRGLINDLEARLQALEDV
jgi:hypothetical protein